MTWQIQPEPSDSIIRSYLLEHPIWTAYAIGDLREPLRQRSTFLLATQGNEWAIVLIYRTTTFTALIPYGPVEGIETIFKAAPQLPKTCIISNLTGDLQAMIEQWYTSTSKAEMMYRMSLNPSELNPFEGFVRCERLSMSNIPEMSGFYAMNNVKTFSPDQVEHGLYYGIRRHGLLVAIGGTHLIDKDDKIAAIGNIYTDSILRGNGYARSIVTELVQQLIKRNMNYIVLNVEKENFSAVQVYEELGFRRYAMFYEGPMKRIKNPSSP